MTSGACVSLGSRIPSTAKGESPRCSGVFPSLSLKVPEACTENPKFQALVLTGPLTHMMDRKKRVLSEPPISLSISRSVWFLQFLLCLRVCAQK